MNSGKRLVMFFVVAQFLMVSLLLGQSNTDAKLPLP